MWCVNVTLWVLQIVFAALFLVHAVLHLFPPAALRAQMDRQNIPRMRALSNGSELLAAVGLVVPPAVGIAPWLTPLAAVGLVVVMAGATAFHLSRKETPVAAFTLALAAALAFLACGRIFLAPFG
jgi:uncharacterized membrane protein YphA (DoxX/SURF4 family)